MIARALGRLLAGVLVWRTALDAWRVARLRRRLMVQIPREVRGEYVTVMIDLLAEELHRLDRQVRRMAGGREPSSLLAPLIDTTAGRFLDEHAAARGVSRAQGESDDQLRERLVAAYRPRFTDWVALANDPERRELERPLDVVPEEWARHVRSRAMEVLSDQVLYGNVFQSEPGGARIDPEAVSPA